MAKDWGFSDVSRDRQSKRIRTFADFEKSHERFVVCDFVCPSKASRKNFGADIVVWMDTNKIFQNPNEVNFHIKAWNDHNHKDIANEILQNV